MQGFTDLFDTRAVISSLAVTSKKALLQQLASIAEAVYGVDSSVAHERLTERERLGSTGFGNGIAIPHARIDGLDHVVAVFARLPQPVDYGAIDDLGVDLVVMLLSPSDAGAEHLKALARISRALRDSAFVAKLRGAGSDDALVALVAAGEARDAA